MGGSAFLRDGDTVQAGDASLQLKPFLQFPGPVLWVEVDPSRQYLVTDHEAEPSRTQASGPGEVGNPGTARADAATDAPGSSQRSDMILRILRREDGKVMLVSHVRSAVHLPINGEGYLELLRANGMGWSLNFDFFSGGSTVIGPLDSACMPLLDFISPGEVLATTCNSNGDPRLVGLGLNGKHLWQNTSVGSSVWPVLVTNATGTRFGRESLMTGHDLSILSPLEPEDIKGQDVQIMDAATGKLVLRAAATPVFDVGGNVAISPSGAGRSGDPDGDESADLRASRAGPGSGCEPAALTRSRKPLTAKGYPVYTFKRERILGHGCPPLHCCCGH